MFAFTGPIQSQELCATKEDKSMCGIAGILFKGDERPDMGFTTGTALTRMLKALVHRGPDSAGFGLYYEPRVRAMRVRSLVSHEAEKGAEDCVRIRQVLIEAGAQILEEESLGCTYGTIVGYDGDVQGLASALERAAIPLSVGRSLDIVKDVGLAGELAERYGIARFDGTHAIGHTRLATESGVHPETSHPFWATGFADVAVVHNGQITNYWIMRRRLEREGMTFHTLNDTELIAVYLAFRMSRGATLEEALRTLLTDLDGTFSCLVATEDSIGYAKDKLAAKPMVKYEDDRMVAIASEEVALNALFPGRTLKTMEPPPLTCGMWSRRAGRKREQEMGMRT
jgi:glutamate synthase domain-containing protein 1